MIASYGPFAHETPSAGQGVPELGLDDTVVEGRVCLVESASRYGDGVLVSGLVCGGAGGGYGGSDERILVNPLAIIMTTTTRGQGYPQLIPQAKEVRHDPEASNLWFA